MSHTRKTAIDKTVESLEDFLLHTRRYLHTYPELSHQEEQTGVFLFRTLQEFHIPARASVGGHGVVVDIEGSKPGPRCAFRVDMDALPIQERSHVSFASKNPGVMHACGHDGHMAIGLGVARTLFLLREHLVGSVRIFFQPAEESVPSGAENMIEAGVLEGVKAIWTVHVDPSLAKGKIGLRSGAITAATDAFTIHIQGKSGHSARPHLSRDANFVAAQMVSAIYHFASTQFDPREPMVANVGVLQGGSASNVIAGDSRIEGVIRTLSKEARKKVPQRFRTLIEGIAKAHEVDANIEILAGSPSQVNDESLTKLTEKAAEEMLGQDAIVQIPLPSMGGEDFSQYTKDCDGVLVRLGAEIPGKTISLHTESFELEESILAVGTRVIANTLILYNATYSL